MKNLNEKIWYRFLKVVFLGAIAIALFGGNFTIYEIVNQKKISNETFGQVGILVKKIYPTYNDIDNINIGKKIYDKQYSFWTTLTTQDSGATIESDAPISKEKFIELRNQDLSVEQIVKLGRAYVPIKYENVYSLWQRVIYHTAVSFAVFLFFWFISRLFFYIFIKDKFFSGMIVNKIKGTFLNK